jgi:hypothetical protein
LSVQAELHREGWLFSGEQVQFRNTVVINLALSEDELLSRMKQKTRYNIRLAERKSVKIRTGSLADLPLLPMYAEISVETGLSSGRRVIAACGRPSCARLPALGRAAWRSLAQNP